MVRASAGSVAHRQGDTGYLGRKRRSLCNLVNEYATYICRLGYCGD